ncbi:MAG TPA: hypothetical protein PLF38_09330, partial [Xylanibacter oryzae]|nr:hypothetical protein [Xylanibacter oryzae]
MLSKILNISKWIAGVIGGITAIAGIVMFIYSQGIKAEQKKSKDTAVIEAVNEVKVNLRELKGSDSLKTIQLSQIISNQKDQSKKLDNLQNSYILHLQESKKFNEAIDLLKAEKKNEGVTLWQIPYKP